MEILNKHKRMFLLSGIALCIVAIILTINPTFEPIIIARGLSQIVVPLQRGVSTSVAWVQGHFVALGRNQELLRENRILREEINHLIIENNRLQRADEENIRLSALLDMNQRYAQLPTMGARIIGQNSNDAVSRFFIDRGSNDYLSRNMAVLGDGGLIGVVRSVKPNHSTFFSIIDPSFSAAVISVRTEDIGNINGDLRLMQQGLIRMDHISATAQIMPGDEIITSPISSIFPPSLPVGTVRSIYSNPDGLTRHAIIIPFADVDNVEMVSIVTEVFGDQHATIDEHLFIDED